MKKWNVYYTVDAAAGGEVEVPNTNNPVEFPSLIDVLDSLKECVLPRPDSQFRVNVRGVRIILVEEQPAADTKETT